MKCPKCEGRGVLFSDTEVFQGWNGVWEREYEEWDCDECDGTGEVEEEQEEGAYWT